MTRSSRAGRVGALALLPVLLAAGVLASPAARPAAAQSEREIDASEQPGRGSPGVALTVADFTGAISPDGTFRLRVRVANRTRRVEDSLRLVATFHRRAFHRLDFARAVDEGRVGDVYTSLDEELTPLEGRRVRTVELRRTAEELGFGQGDVQGVYPLVIRLLRDDDTVQTVRTAVVVVTSEVAQPLRAALVVPLDAAPALQPGGTLRPETYRQDLAPRGRLRALLSDVGERPDVPVTFAVDARMLDDVADFADGYQSEGADGEVAPSDESSSLARAARGFLGELRRVLPQPQVETLALPYGPADLSALVRGGMQEEAARLISEGAARVEAHTTARPARGVLLPADALSPGALSQAVGAGVETLVVESDWIEPAAAPSTASPVPVRELRTPAGTTVDTVVPDPWLSELLADEDTLAELDRPVAVQRLIAETAAVYFERPFADEPRGLLLLPPLHWDPPPGFAGGLAGALKAAPWLQPVTVDGLLDELDAPDRSPARVDYPQEARRRELSQTYVTELRAARRALGSLAGVLAADTETPGRYDRMLLAAASVWYRERPAEGLALIREVVRTVEELYDSVEVAAGPTVLLSGIEGQIPVTVRNRSAIPLRLAIRLETQRFAFEDGPMRLLVVAPGAVQTVAFQAHDRSPGRTSPIQVVVADADGQLVLAEGTVVVRSTAVSAAALAVVIGAGLFLLAWWLRTFRRGRRRDARDAPAASDAA